MRLHNLIKTEGHKRRKRIGRGEGSGRGKTSGRGHKGQRSRSGFSLRPGFESGHVPLYRKLPKRGFSNHRFRTEYAIVNVGDLARLDGETVTMETLVTAGLVRKSSLRLKVLGEGDVERAFHVTADKVSSGAREKIEKAGGSVTVTAIPKKAAQKEGESES